VTDTDKYNQEKSQVLPLTESVYWKEKNKGTKGEVGLGVELIMPEGNN
jgi:hypothetical protein